jgi:GT2 family glycosyltransferase
MQFIKRDTFLSVGGFNEQLILGEDVDLILRISERSKNINLFHIPIPVYYYRDSPDGRCNSRWEELKYQMERVYLESSKRQNLSFCVYKYIGAFALEENIFRYIKDDGYFSHNSLYDIYLPIDENNKIMPRSYVRMQIDPQ